MGLNRGHTQPQLTQQQQLEQAQQKAAEREQQRPQVEEQVNKILGDKLSALSTTEQQTLKQALTNSALQQGGRRPTIQHIGVDKQGNLQLYLNNSRDITLEPTKVLGHPPSASLNKPAPTLAACKPGDPLPGNHLPPQTAGDRKVSSSAALNPLFKSAEILKSPLQRELEFWNSPREDKERVMRAYQKDSENITREVLPKLHRQLNQIKTQYDKTSMLPWKERPLKKQLSKQIHTIEQKIEYQQDTLVRNRQQSNKIFEHLNPGTAYMQASPGREEQASLNRAAEKQQRAIENIDNWRTGPVLGGPAMVANAMGAPPEVVRQLREAGEGLAAGYGVRSGRPNSGINRGPTHQGSSLNYRPVKSGNSNTYGIKNNTSTLTLNRAQGNLERNATDLKIEQTAKNLQQKLNVTINTQQFKETYNRAGSAKREIDTLADNIASKYDGTVAKAPLKSIERSMEKIAMDYNGDSRQIKDLARNTIIVDQKNIPNVLNELKAAGAKIKEHTTENNALGYTGFNAVLQTRSGISSEIQVNTPGMIYAKEPAHIAKSMMGDKLYNDIANKAGVEGGQGHKLYEQWRVLDSESLKAKEIAEQSRQYHSTIRRLTNDQ